MEFGTWVKHRRLELSLDLRAFAALTGVDATTISRIERGSQATLATVVRICEGVGVSLADLLVALEGKSWLNLEQPQNSKERIMPAISDIEALLTYMRLDQQALRDWLAVLLNRIALLNDPSAGRVQGNKKQLFVPEDIDKLLLSSPLYHFVLQYPTSIQAEDILEIYRGGGILTLMDIGVYVRKARRSKQVTLTGIEDAVQLSANVLSRLETGSMERIKFNDVILLDKQLGQEGMVVAMYWSVYSSTHEIIHRQQLLNNRHSSVSPGKGTEQEMKLINIFTVICRWFQALSQDTSWVKELRCQFHHQQV